MGGNGLEESGVSEGAFDCPFLFDESAIAFALLPAVVALLWPTFLSAEPLFEPWMLASFADSLGRVWPSLVPLYSIHFGNLCILWFPCQRDQNLQILHLVLLEQW